MHHPRAVTNGGPGFHTSTPKDTPVDTSLDAVLGALPQAGAGGIFLFLLVLMVRRESTAQERFTAEYDRINQAHDAELSELREQLAAMRAQLDELNQKLDSEREERRRAEDEAAKARRSLT